MREVKTLRQPWHFKRWMWLWMPSPTRADGFCRPHAAAATRGGCVGEAGQR
jgi:hypothetical protein